MANAKRVAEHEAAISAVLKRWSGRAIEDLHEVAHTLGQMVTGSDEVSCAKVLSRLRTAAEVRGYDVQDLGSIEANVEAGMHAPRSIEDLLKVRSSPANDNHPLPVIDPRNWQGKAIPEREWFVENLIPSRTVTNFSGDGGSGKTLIILQLIAASALRMPWLGMTVGTGPCLYYGAEDESDELQRRFAAILNRAGRSFSDLDGVRLISMAEQDAVIAAPDRGGKLAETSLFPKLRAEVDALRPKLVVVDPVADIFGGDEIKREQARAFVSMLRKMALEFDTAVVFLSHPSLTGIASGSGGSGSTAWRNSVRSRLYLEVPTTASKPDPDIRILHGQKANYGRTGWQLKVRWTDGVYEPDAGLDPAVASVLNSAVDSLFIELLSLFAEQGQNLTATSGASYAPARMAKHAKAKGYSKAALAEAMQRLLDAKRIRVVTEGPPSKKRSRLVAVD